MKKKNKMQIATKHRQGYNMWIVSSWSEEKNSYCLSEPVSHWEACTLVRNYKYQWSEAKQKYINDWHFEKRVRP
jgi:hypothetical protein